MRRQSMCQTAHQLQIGNDVTNVSLGAGGVLTLNGAGKPSGANPQGALQFQLNVGTTITGVDSVVSNPVVLASDSRDSGSSDRNLWLTYERRFRSRQAHF